MKAVGLDTCVVLRILMWEPEAQAACAYDYIQSACDESVAVCVSDLVVVETYHALLYHYDVPEREVVRTLREFLASPMVTTTGHALSVLDTFTGRGAGFVDRLIRMDLLDSAHEVVTFDRDFARLPNVVRLDQ